ncbi:zinc finger protein 497-like [Galendromus occidentalis]|uniref:Zinc finger protein 497-like n=1 Tax=Galendromus occidentalis TaxID=34638 RepID=A0AAJ6QXW8_9ACAR|nr:zinc finger protein 497-like [Galendromus occidentalis]
MEKRNESDEHPILLQTTVVNPSTGLPICTLIKLPPGTTIENLTNSFKKKSVDVRPTLKKEVVALTRLGSASLVAAAASAATASASSAQESSDESVEDGKANTSDDSMDGVNVSSCVSDDTRSEADRDNLASPPSSPGVATILSLIPEPQRAGCHNGHKATILGGRYVLQKTNSRARLTGPFFCNACGLRFDWHSSARMHLNFHNRDFEACDKCQKRTSPDSCGSSTEKTGRPPRCNVCNKSFYLWKTYLAHQEKHKDKVKCPLCCKFFQSLHNVGRHYYDEHNGVPVVCSLCGNGYRAFKQYQSHVETMHMGEEDVKGALQPSNDDAINYSIDLPTLQQLDPSIRIFSSVERTCPVPNCGRIFSTQHTMQRHIYDVHCNELLPCGLCGNAYRTYSQFERHCEVFHGENFRVELPVGEINVPVKRKRERAAAESENAGKTKRPKSRGIDAEVSSSESNPPDEPLDMTVVKQELSDDVILPD